MIPQHLPMSIVREIEKLSSQVKQSFVSRSDGLGWKAYLLTSTNSLSNSPSVYLGEFENKDDAFAMAKMAFDYAFKFQNKGRVESMAEDKELELKSQELPSVASGDQNKITGLEVAAGRIEWQKFGEKKNEAGYVFKKNHGFAFKIGQPALQQHSVTMEGLLDCIQQLEAMGDAATVKAAMGYTDGQGPINNGLVIISKVDPRIKMAVTPTSTDNEQVDFWVGWYLDTENLDHEMKVVNPKYEPEHTVDPEELKVVDRAREENPVLNQTEEDIDFSEADLLALPESKSAVTEMIRTTKTLSEDNSGPTFEPSEYDKLSETGESDGDYNTAAYDAIAKALAKKGYKASHKEFDKYQGVYLDVSKGSKKVRLWTVDEFVTGKRKPPKSDNAKAVLRDLDGEYSATPGDYFQLPDNHVFKGLELVVTKQDGSKKVIKNPKKKDLPEVDGYIEYEGKPDEVFVFEPEDSQNRAEVKLTHDYKKVEVSDLVALLGDTMGESKNNDEEQMNYKDISEDFEHVDFWGVPLVESDSEGTPMGKNIGPAGKKVGTGYGETDAKKPVYSKDIKTFDKEIDKKDDSSLGKGGDSKPVPVEAGSALEKPKSEEGDEYGEKDADKKNQLGDPKDGVGDHMAGKGKSNDQQTDVPKNKVKPGAVDSTPKVVGESEEEPKTEPKKKDMDAYMEGFHAATKDVSEWVKGKKSMEEMDKMAMDPEKKKDMEPKGLDYVEGYNEAMGHMTKKLKECDMGGMKDKPTTMPSDAKPAAEAKTDKVDGEEKKAMDAAKKTESKKLSIPEWAKKKK